jgi:hypothetical protein
MKGLGRRLSGKLGRGEREGFRPFGARDGGLIIALLPIYASGELLSI